jgi:hypothetical protein
VFTLLSAHNLSDSNFPEPAEAAQSADVQAEMLGIKGRFQEVLAPLMPRGSQLTILEALRPVLEAHPGMWPGMALYWLRRQTTD